MRWLDNLRQSSELFAAPGRCVHVGEICESDIYELYCLAQELGTHFIVRSCVDRMAGDGDQKLYALMDEVKIQGTSRRRRSRQQRQSRQGQCRNLLSHASCHASDRKHKRYPALVLTAIRAREKSVPEHRAPDRLAVADELAGRQSRGRAGKNPLVRSALENRSVPQDPKIGMPSGRRQAQNSGPPRETDHGVLHPELARLLDDHDQSIRARRRIHASRLTKNGNRNPRSPRARQEPPAPNARCRRTSSKIARLGGYLGSRERPTARQHRHVARFIASHGHQARRRHRSQLYG